MIKWSTSAATSLAALALCSAFLPGVAGAQNVVTYHNTPDRAGVYTVPGLTFAAAAKLHPDPAFKATLSGNIYAQPLYWKPAGAKTGLLIVATESNLVYALNANTGAQVWRTQLGTPIPSGVLSCGDITPEGVTGTPVIDPATGRLYLDAATLQPGSKPRHMIYALSLSDGKIVPHWPINVDHAMIPLKFAFQSDAQGERSALQFFKGRLYVAYGGRAGDCADKNRIFYHGVVIEVTPSTVPEITADWETRASRGGIWAQGGPISDGTSLYVTTGNTSGATVWSDGEAVIRLLPGLARSTNSKDSFAPSDWKTLDNGDADVGGTSAIPFTVQGASGPVVRLLALSKVGHAYLVDAANLGGIGGQIIDLPAANGRVITAPAVYETGPAALLAFTSHAGLSESCSGANVTMLKITADAKSPISTAWCAPLTGQGAPIVTSTDGTANPIVWVTGAEGDDQLHGFNALTGTAVFSGEGTAMTGLHRYGTPIAANHHLYVAADGTIYAFTF